ncbi:MAG: phosphate ABC transporter permease PstA [Silvanigrellaceae bacterium]|nr:phosphate ABC transporter permease PstA [Silvanigrellaceae bacterium]
MVRNFLFRNIVNLVFICFCTFGAILGACVLFSIFISLIINGFHALSLNLFLLDTPAPSSVGGLANAIMGSFLITILATCIATPIGVLSATYLSEYASNKKIVSILRFINDVWLSAPSIIIGLFVYILVVASMKTYSALAGVIALAIIACPIITRTAEDVLALVPKELREAAYALGIPKWRVIVSISWRAARQGILTGILLSIARISGETAPLLFTTLNNQFWSTDLFQPMANLPATIYQFSMSPYQNWQDLAWAGSLFMTITVLFLNIFSRYFILKKRKH